MKQAIEFCDTEECGCESGKAYAKCCKKTRVRYTRDGWGRVHKTIVLNEGGRDAVQDILAAFKKTFGRSPGRRDRMLLGAYRHSPNDFTRMFLEIAEKADTPKHLVYAYVQTGGIILTDDNEELASPQDIEDVQIAVEEYLAAQEMGLDLLEPEETLTSLALKEFVDYLEDSVVHIGNFADKAPRAVRKDLPLFFQFLLISRCHQAIKSVADRWPQNIGNETIASIRTLFECTLIINRLEFDPLYADTLLAQALVGSDLYAFRTKNSGDPDFSVIVERSTGRKFEARTSFAGCAKHTGQRHLDFFNIAYPILSSHVHFNSLSMLQKYRSSGSFLMWNESEPKIQAILVFIVLAYLMLSIYSIRKSTAIIKRDAFRFFGISYFSLIKLMDAIDSEDYELDEGVMLLTIRAMELFTNKDFIDEFDNNVGN